MGTDEGRVEIREISTWGPPRLRFPDLSLGFLKYLDCGALFLGLRRFSEM